MPAGAKLHISHTPQVGLINPLTMVAIRGTLHANHGQISPTPLLLTQVNGATLQVDVPVYLAYQQTGGIQGLHAGSTQEHSVVSSVVSSATSTSTIPSSGMPSCRSSPIPAQKLTPTETKMNCTVKENEENSKSDHVEDLPLNKQGQSQSGNKNTDKTKYESYNEKMDVSETKRDIKDEDDNKANDKEDIHSTSSTSTSTILTSVMPNCRSSPIPAQKPAPTETEMNVKVKKKKENSENDYVKDLPLNKHGPSQSGDIETDKTENESYNEELDVSKTESNIKHGDDNTAKDGEDIQSTPINSSNELCSLGKSDNNKTNKTKTKSYDEEMNVSETGSNIEHEKDNTANDEEDIHSNPFNSSDELPKSNALELYPRQQSVISQLQSSSIPHKYHKTSIINSPWEMERQVKRSSSITSNQETINSELRVNVAETDNTTPTHSPPTTSSVIVSPASTSENTSPNLPKPTNSQSHSASISIGCHQPITVDTVEALQTALAGDNGGQWVVSNEPLETPEFKALMRNINQASGYVKTVQGTAQKIIKPPSILEKSNPSFLDLDMKNVPCGWGQEASPTFETYSESYLHRNNSDSNQDITLQDLIAVEKFDQSQMATDHEGAWQSQISFDNLQNLQKIIKPPSILEKSNPSFLDLDMKNVPCGCGQEASSTFETYSESYLHRNNSGSNHDITL